MTEFRVLPRLDSDNRFFWTSGGDGALRFLRCGDCAKFVHPPFPVCSRCLSENLAPEAVAGTGQVLSYTVNHQKWHPGLAEPFIIARIAIDGTAGPAADDRPVILTSNIVDCPVDSVAIGDAVRVTFQPQGEIFLPLFEKAD